MPSKVSSIQCTQDILIKIFTALGILLLLPGPAFSSNIGTIDFRSYVSNSIVSLEPYVDFSVTSSNILWTTDPDGKSNAIISKISYLCVSGNYKTVYTWLGGSSPAYPEIQSTYNGKRYAQYLGGILNQINYSAEDQPTSVFPINPIIAPLAFLSYDGDACPECFLRMKDIANLTALQYLEKLKITQIPKRPLDENEEYFNIPCGDVGGSPAYWVVGFQKNGSSYVISSADKFTAQGNTQLIYDFLYYTNLISGKVDISYPTMYTIQVIEDNQTKLTGSIKVVDFTINPPVSTNTFDILAELGSSATRIYNKDTRTYDKIPEKHNPEDVGFQKTRAAVLIIFVVISAGTLYALITSFKRK